MSNEPDPDWWEEGDLKYHILAPILWGIFVVIPVVYLWDKKVLERWNAMRFEGQLYPYRGEMHRI